jgi:hypothetical protein
MSNDLLKESIIGAKKLKEVAEENAKKQILESISPQIKKMIQSKFNANDFLFEQTETEEEFSEEDEAVEPVDEDGLELPVEPEAVVPSANPVPELDLEGDEAPLAAVVDDALVSELEPEDSSLTLPDEDGKIVIDFEDLFVAEDEDEGDSEDAEDDVELPQTSDLDSHVDVATAAEPAPESMLAHDLEVAKDELAFDEVTDEEELKDDYELALENLLKKASKSLKENNTALKQSLEKDFFVLLEKLDSLKEKGLISSKQKEENEHKLNFLYRNLNKRIVENTYKNKKEDTDMKSTKTLKRFARKLFENDEHSSHAVHTSSEMSHDLEDLELDLSDLELGLEPTETEETPWDDAEHHVTRDEQEEVLLDVGDLDELSDEEEFEVDVEELAEAVAALKDAKYKKEHNHNLDEDLEFSVTVDVPEEVEEALADLDEDDFDIEVVLSDDEDLEVEHDEEHSHEHDEDCEDEVFHVVDDEDELEPELEVEVDLDPEFESDLEELDSEFEPEFETLEEKKMKLKESRLRRARARRRLVESRAARRAAKPVRKPGNVAELSRQLHETNLFAAKAVYLNKFLMREGLSKKVVRQIVEHLDGAKTLAEAKTIYNKIEEKLNKNAPQTKLTGSASRATRSGAANRLQENVSLNGNKQLIDVERWQRLAGIKVKK